MKMKENTKEEMIISLYEKLIAVEIEPNIQQLDIVDAFLRATCVAAGISFDREFYQALMLQLAERAGWVVDFPTQIYEGK